MQWPAPNSSSLSFEGKFTKTVKCHVIFTNMTYTCGVDITKKRLFINNINQNGAMDVVQGGMFDTQGILKSSFDQPLKDALNDVQWRQYNPNHAFIPTVSSLAFKNPNFDWSKPINRNLICDPNNKEIPFDNYFVASKNEDHVFVSAENATWLMKELDGIPQAPYFPIDATQFTGATTICTNATSTYSFPDICKIPGNASWSLNNSNTQIVSSTGSSVNLKGIASGSAILTATFQNGETITKKIYIGKPLFHIEPAPKNTNYVTFNLVSDDPNASLEKQGLTPTQVVWERLNDGITKTGFSYFYAGPTNYNWSFQVNVTATNSCGSTILAATIAPPPPPPSNCSGYSAVSTSKGASTYRVIIIPCLNANRQINTNETLQADAQDISIVITNIQGKIMINSKGTDIDLSTQLLGTYYLTIIKNGKIVHTQTLLKN